MTEQEKFEAWYVKEYGCHPSKHNDARDHALLDCWKAAIASRGLIYKLSDCTGVTVEQNAGCNSDKGATIVNRKRMTEVEAMQIVSTRPYGTLVNSLHYAIRETELFHGIVK